VQNVQPGTVITAKISDAIFGHNKGGIVVFFGPRFDGKKFKNPLFIVAENFIGYFVRIAVKNEVKKASFFRRVFKN
jgi:hypothetical protein